MPYVDLPGVHLWYNDTGGTGVPVVFMHAASGTCESWVPCRCSLRQATGAFPTTGAMGPLAA